MSQHIFHTTCIISSIPEDVIVLMGWDRPLQGYFLVIDKGNSIFDEPVWSNLDHEPSHPKTLEIFLMVLNDLKIYIPRQMIEEILQDSFENVGNKYVYHTIKNGVYKRALSNK